MPLWLHVSEADGEKQPSRNMQVSSVLISLPPAVSALSLLAFPVGLPSASELSCCGAVDQQTGSVQLGTCAVRGVLLEWWGIRPPKMP